jgi:hypothetical protein
MRRLLVALPEALEDAQNGLSHVARKTLAQSLKRLRETDRSIDYLVVPEHFTFTLPASRFLGLADQRFL